MTYPIQELSQHSSIYRGFLLLRRPATILSKTTRYEVTLSEQSFGLFDTRPQATGYIDKLYSERDKLEVGTDETSAVIVFLKQGQEQVVGSIFKRRYENMEPDMYKTDLTIGEITFQRRFPKQQCFAEGLQLTVLPFPESEH